MVGLRSSWMTWPISGMTARTWYAVSPWRVAVHGSRASFASPLVCTVTVPAGPLCTDTTRWVTTLWSPTGMWYVMTMPLVTSETAMGVTTVTSPGLIFGAMLPVSMVMVR